MIGERPALDHDFRPLARPTLVASPTILVLPAAKALFIGILWRTQAPGSDMD